MAGPRPGLAVIWATFFVALCLTLLPLPGWAEPLRPEWVLLALIYWAMALPHRVGLGTAWILGLLVDVAKGAVLGQHALCMAITVYIVLRTYLRVRNFPVWQQSAVVAVLLTVYESLIFMLDGFLGHALPAWHWPAIITGAVLWPVVFSLLRGLRRRYQVA